MMRILAILVVAAGLAAAEGSRNVIPDIERMEGPDPTLFALGRAVRAAGATDVTDADLFGLTGVAFLATVCANNCNCRDYREPALRIDPALRRLGIEFTHYEWAGPEAWEPIRKSIDDGVPAVVFNLFGDYEDAIFVGYDLEKDEAYGWGAKPAGDSYGVAKLSAWREQEISGWVIRKSKRPQLDRAALEREALALAVASARRHALEGG